MPCYRPLQGYRRQPGGPVFFYDRQGDELVTIACGQCIGCRLERSREWAVRVVHESKLYESSEFVTLTYRDEELPPGGSLWYPHYQAFMHRLRKWSKRRGQVRPRFYMCGEYGEERFRPHYHACLFGVRFERGYRVAGELDQAVYQSPDLERLWPHGLSSTGEVTFESAAYVARYCTEKVTGVRYMTGWHPYMRADPRTGEIFEVEPEFNHMSLKPGLGARWLERFRSDVYPEGKVVSRGRLVNAPRYYNKLQKKLALAEVEEMKAEQAFEAYQHRSDGTPERLSAREKVARARLSLSKRKIK